RDAEDDLALGLADALEHRRLRVLRVLAQHRDERLEDLAHGLVQLHLARVALQHLGKGPLQLVFHQFSSGSTVATCRSRRAPGAPASMTISFAHGESSRNVRRRTGRTATINRRCAAGWPRAPRAPRPARSRTTRRRTTP